MRIANILAAIVIAIGTIYVSFHHTISLYEAGGMTGTMAYAATIVVELMFLMGGTNMVVHRMRGNKVGWPSTAGAMAGVAMVTWSNIYALVNYGVLGIILGASTPIFLIIAESILSYEIIQRRTATTPAEDAPTPVEKTDTITSPIEAVEAAKEPHVPPIETPVIETQLPAEKTEQKEENAAAKKASSTKRKPAKKKAPKPKKKPAMEVDYDAIMEVAKQLQTEREKVGRDLLAKEADTTPHHARIALAKLEQMEQQQEAEKPKLALAK